MIFQTDLAHEALFNPPYLDGGTKQAAIDSAVARVLPMKFELRLFDEPYQSDSLLHALDLQLHTELAYEMAVKSAVLLKNRNGTLPLPNKSAKILVVCRDAVEARPGGYSCPSNAPVSIRSGLNARDVDETYEKGVDRIEHEHAPVPAHVLFHGEGARETGLLGTYYNGIDLNAQPAFTRTDAQIDFQWTLFGPNPRATYDHFGVRWEGSIVPQESGVFPIGVEGNDGYRLWLNGDLYIDRWEEQGYGTEVMPFSFTKGRPTALRIEYCERAGNARFKLVWNAGIDTMHDERMIQEAVDKAREHDRVIIVAGIEEGEFRDRSSLKLPGRQEELVKRVAATGKSVTVVLVGGSAITMDNWSDDVDAVLMAWYTGEAGGLAIADILLGTQNPSGRLPITFPRNEGQLPLVYNHYPTGRGDDYVDGTGQPLFPFGYELSYTRFDYSDFKLSRSSFTD